MKKLGLCYSNDAAVIVSTPPHSPVRLHKGLEVMQDLNRSRDANQESEIRDITGKERC